MATNEGLSITENIDNKRYYRIDKDGVLYKLPSVTTVLGNMTDQSSLENWRKRIGYAEAERISRFSANRGTCMHQKLEFWFTSDIEDPKARLEDVNKKMAEFVKENGYTEDELRVGNQLFDKLYICGFFRRIDSIVEMEETLYSFDNGGYAGRVDCIYKNNSGENVLLDFKTSKHTKQKEWITNYLLQLSAYFNAYYQMTGIELDKAELWISCEIDPPQLVEISKEELKIWLKHFLRLVKGYHEKFDYLLEERKQEKTEMSESTTKLYENLKVRSLTSNQVDDKKKLIKSENTKTPIFDMNRFLKYKKPLFGEIQEYLLEPNFAENVKINISTDDNIVEILPSNDVFYDFVIRIKTADGNVEYKYYDTKIAFDEGEVYISEAKEKDLKSKFESKTNKIDGVILVGTYDALHPNNKHGHLYAKPYSKLKECMESNNGGWNIPTSIFKTNTVTCEEFYYGWEREKRFDKYNKEYGVSVNDFNYITRGVFNKFKLDINNITKSNTSEEDCIDFLLKVRKSIYKCAKELNISDDNIMILIKRLDKKFKQKENI